MENKKTEGSYLIAKYSNYVLLRLIGDLNDVQAQRYQQLTLPQIVMADRDLIINCDYLTMLSKTWIDALNNTEQALRRVPKRTKLILIPVAIQKIFKQNGLSQLFQCNSNLRSALLSLGLVNKQIIDVEFVNPFLQATIDVLETLTTFKATPGAIFIKKNSNQLLGDISGVIGLVSDSFNGNVTITFPEKTFLNIMSKIHKETHTAINEENADGASEMSNMIFGHAKIILNEQGYGIKTALPSVIIGNNHHFYSGKQSPIVVVPFTAEIGNFFVEISLSDNVAY